MNDTLISSLNDINLRNQLENMRTHFFSILYFARAPDIGIGVVNYQCLDEKIKRVIFARIIICKRNETDVR